MASCRIAALLVLCAAGAQAAPAQKTPAPPAATLEAPLAFNAKKSLEKLPKLYFRNEDGVSITLDDVRGQITVVHFWALWCVPCVKELPKLNAIAKEYGPRQFRVVAISLDNNIAKVKAFFKEHKLNSLTPYVDYNMGSFRAAKATALPTSIFVNSEGYILKTHEGEVDWTGEEARRFIDSKLNE